MDLQRMGKQLHRYRSKIAKQHRALKEIADVVPSPANTLAWRMVLIARKAIGQIDEGASTSTCNAPK